MIDFLNCDITQIEELERQAYTDYPKASILFQALIELREEIEKKEQEISTLEDDSLSAWEKKNGPADTYKEFFNDCFERLNGHYPCPSVTSNYDQRVIFDAIEKGEEVKENE
jgi:hypothetical protein